MERCLEKNMYSMTISPPYRLFDPEVLYHQDTPLICNWLRKFSDHYIMFTEFDPNNRIHYHLTVRIKDKIKYYKTKYSLERILGFVKTKRLIKPIDLLRWTMYIRKDYYINYKIFKFIIYKRKDKKHRLQNVVICKDCLENNRRSILSYF